MTATNPSVPSARAQPGGATWLYRISTGLAALSLFFQSVTAGQFISDKHDHLAFTIHRVNALIAVVLVIVVIVAAILIRVRENGRMGQVWQAVGLFVLVALVIVAGFAKLTPLHIPLAVAIIAMSLAMAVTAWRPSGVRRIPVAAR
jgi:uncharacterized membrane protein YoaK (UPF0700 family)